MGGPRKRFIPPLICLALVTIAGGVLGAPKSKAGAPTQHPGATPPEGDFDPDGYYFPTHEVKIGPLWFQSFDVETRSYLRDGQLDYEHPVELEPRARLYLTKTRAEEAEATTYDAKEVTVSPGGINAKWQVPLIGSVTLRGRFLFGGRFWDRSDIHPDETIVLRSTLMMTAKQAKQMKVDFTYWQGD